MSASDDDPHSTIIRLQREGRMAEANALRAATLAQEQAAEAAARAQRLPIQARRQFDLFHKAQGLIFPEELLTAPYIDHLPWAMDQHRLEPKDWLGAIVERLARAPAQVPVRPKLPNTTADEVDDGTRSDQDIKRENSRHKRRQAHLDRPREPAPQPRKPRVYPADNFVINLHPIRESLHQLKEYGYAVWLGRNKGLEYSSATKAQQDDTLGKGQGAFATTIQIYRHLMATYPECRAAPSEAILSVANEVVLAFIAANKNHKLDGSPYAAPKYRKWDPGKNYFHVNGVSVHLDRKVGCIKLPKLHWIEASGINKVPDWPIKSATVRQVGYNWIVVLKLRRPDA
jgi:hypothetical protein